MGYDGTFKVTVPKGHYVELNITFSTNGGFMNCFRSRYFQIRDGIDKSSSLLDVFCENKESVYRTSAHNMWGKLSYTRYSFKFEANYAARRINSTGM